MDSLSLFVSDIGRKTFLFLRKTIKSIMIPAYIGIAYGFLRRCVVLTQGGKLHQQTIKKDTDLRERPFFKRGTKSRCSSYL